jgi:hypothetical protein
MALSFFIQEGVVSTGKKTVGTLAQLFDVTRWLKFALKSLGVVYYDPCEPTCLPTQGATIGMWATAPLSDVVAGVPVIGWNTTDGCLDVWTGSEWKQLFPPAS